MAIALIGAVGIGAQWVAWRTGWPAIALMLAAGVIAGPVTGLIHPEEIFGAILEPMISIAVALILFVPVLISDTSWQSLAPARQAGIPTYHGEILAEATEDRLDLSHYQVLAATSENEAYNALVCNEFAPELGRDAVYQLGDAAEDDPRSLPETLRGRAMFTSGAGVDELKHRERAGWTFRQTRLTDQFGFDDAKASLPPEADMLLLVRKDGVLRFFTHASRPSAQPGDVVISYVPAKADVRPGSDEKAGTAAATGEGK